MKKKTILKIVLLTFIATAATLSSFKASNISSRATLGTLLFESLEALAETEQPDINDCIDSEEWDCIALHPTDPDKDKVKENAMWPV